ncbi:MAG: DEAD/DEAH box helicase family protein [Alphaproteobacteria bacterium GM7ARS4]|nr:DEAD/DEAH box helicase family protein [Alphaproteobacteria bacterium GM7ARS4]
MELKDYQETVLERLTMYLDALNRHRLESERRIAVLKKGAVKPCRDDRDFATKCWQELVRDLPRVAGKHGGLFEQSYKPRWSEDNEPIPNICLQVPTAGGKTLLAAHSVERLHLSDLKRQNGLVLWIVPSRTIYKQTWKQLANRLHPYRQTLDRASGGRVKLIEKHDSFKADDVRTHLCVMLVMLAATGRKEPSDFLKIYRDSGHYPSFFPRMDDFPENNRLLNEHPDLERANLADDAPLVGISIKHSLLNVFKLCRPVIVLDEGHRAYSQDKRTILNRFNPHFILELSATPNNKEQLSNVLVSVSGLDLHKEKMIKLPVNVHCLENVDWKDTLRRGNECLQELQVKADALEQKHGRYIRPILLVRAERTGKDQQDGEHIHAEDVRKVCIEQLEMAHDAVRVKSADKDELADQDLLERDSPVRVIITKDALREGWDCPFAYVLVLLDNTKAMVSLTQMTGRILRQPETKACPEDFKALNECHIFCYNQSLADAVAKVKQGLEGEGLSGIDDMVYAHGLDGDGGGADTAGEGREVIWRRPAFRGQKIFLPKVLHKDEKKKWRDINYTGDILNALDWDSIDYTGEVCLDGLDKARERIASIDLKGQQGDFFRSFAANPTSYGISGPINERDIAIDNTLSEGFFCRGLIGLVPNPWQAFRIVRKLLDNFREHDTEEKLFDSRLHVLEAIKWNLREIIENEAQKLFCQKLRDGVITFHLAVSHDERLNDVVRESLNVIQRGDVLDQDKNLYEKIFSDSLNTLEKNFAIHVDRHEATVWWHRLAARGEGYPLQGWRRHKVYPDFLVCKRPGDDGKEQLLVLEIKGDHLAGNTDTKYKQNLFKVLEGAYEKAMHAGQFDMLGEEGRHVSCRLLFAESWRDEVNHILR